MMCALSALRLAEGVAENCVNVESSGRKKHSNSGYVQTSASSSRMECGRMNNCHKSYARLTVYDLHSLHFSNGTRCVTIFQSNSN